MTLNLFNSIKDPSINYQALCYLIKVYYAIKLFTSVNTIRCKVSVIIQVLATTVHQNVYTHCFIVETAPVLVINRT